MVRVVGLEPTRIAAEEPKSSESTNSTIPAYLILRFARVMKTFTEVTRPKSGASANSAIPASMPLSYHV